MEVHFLDASYVRCRCFVFRVSREKQVLGAHVEVGQDHYHYSVVEVQTTYE